MTQQLGRDLLRILASYSFEIALAVDELSVWRGKTVYLNGDCLFKITYCRSSSGFDADDTISTLFWQNESGAACHLNYWHFTIDEKTKKLQFTGRYPKFKYFKAINLKHTVQDKIVFSKNTPHYRFRPLCLNGQIGFLVPGFDVIVYAVE